jgi:cardiolipin hydrolase
MDTRAIDRALRATLDDLRLSRAERRALGEEIDRLAPDAPRRAQVRSRAFDLAAEHIRDESGRRALAWLEDVVRLTEVPAPPEVGSLAEAWFSPGVDCRNRLLQIIRRSRVSLDVCVFTITDNTLSRALFEARERGLGLRVVTDDDKAWDRGSDIAAMVDAGIEVRTDRSSAHMHHKFVISDRRLVATGSYNWTRSAARENQENLVVSDAPELVARFREHFDDLWSRFA